MCIDTVGTAAIGDNLDAVVERCSDALKISQRDIPRPGMCPMANSSAGRTSRIVTEPSAIRWASSSRLTGSWGICAIRQVAQDTLDLSEIAFCHNADKVH